MAEYEEPEDHERRADVVRLIVDGVVVAEGCRPRTELEEHLIQARRLRQLHGYYDGMVKQPIG